MVLMHYDYEPVWITDSYSYLDYFKERWEEKESFLNCEHDSVFWFGAVEEIERCPEGWCSFGVSNEDSFKDGTTPTLALAKFSGEFIEKYSDVWDDSNNPYPKSTVPKWKLLDVWLHRYMQGITCHQHYPPIVNANPVKTVVKVIR
jgi:hypothetical protein